MDTWFPVTQMYKIVSQKNYKYQLLFLDCLFILLYGSLLIKDLDESYRIYIDRKRCWSLPVLEYNLGSTGKPSSVGNY
jgi:hypothetical protein